MDNNSKVGEILERGQSLVTSQVKQVVKATQQQIVGNQQAAPDVSQNPLGPGVEQGQSQQKPQVTQAPANNPLQQLTGIHQNSPSELAQIDQARKSLLAEQHKSTYYNPTFNAPKRAEEPVAEKLEREKQEDLWKKQQDDAKKPEPIAVTRGKMRNELNRGASG